MRITPSKGDGGVDILHRHGDGPGQDVVYQVKRHTDKLASKQKKDIEESLGTLLSDKRWKDLNISRWNLVLPWDPSPEAERWFQDLVNERQIDGVWHGFSYVEQLAAKYPDVIDYLLHGGRERLQEMQREIFALAGVDAFPEGVTVTGALPKLKKAIGALQHDPYYRYELRLGQGNPPRFGHDRPNLVFSAAIIDPVCQNGTWAIVDVIARCAESTSLSPIEFTGTFTAEKGSQAEAELEAFVGFGAPLRAASFTGELIAPGGLGDQLTQATATLLSAELPNKEDRALHMDVKNPKGTLLGEVDINRMESSSGHSGIRVLLTEANGIFELELRMPWSDIQTATAHLRLEDFAGKPILTVEPAIRFLAACQSPNHLRLGRRHAWPGSAEEASSLTQLMGDLERRRAYQQLAAWLADLHIIQEHTKSVIPTPAIEDVTAGEVAAWRTASRILQGEYVVRKYPEGHGLVVNIPRSEKPPEFTDSITIEIPLVVKVKEMIIELGEIWIDLPEPKIVGSQETESEHWFQIETKNREFVSRLPAPQKEAGPEP